MQRMLIRFATEDDAAAVCAIYNQGIEERDRDPRDGAAHARRAAAVDGRARYRDTR